MTANPSQSICTNNTQQSPTPNNSYPSVIVPGQLFLGDWADAEAADRLAELGIKR